VIAMNRNLMLAALVLFNIIMFVTVVYTLPSEDYYVENDDVYDDWRIARTRAYGFDGFFQISSIGTFRPAIVFESIEPYDDIAYGLGEQFAEKYHDQYELAERIFNFVRDNVWYRSDIDLFGYPEFAQNADELINRIENGLGKGDCEDVAVLLAVMYNGAGLRSAIILAPNHAATAVFLPSYNEANVFWTFNSETGWVWAEATGRNNPFGKTPMSLIEEDIVFYDIVNNIQGSAVVMTADGGSGTTFIIPSESIFLIIILIMFILPLFRRL